MQIKNTNISKSQQKELFKKRLYQLVLEVLRMLLELPKNEVARVVSNQLIRSITSVLANYIEAQSASSKKEHILGYNHALKSANESKVWLALVRDTLVVDKKQVNLLLSEVTEIANILAASIITMKNK